MTPEGHKPSEKNLVTLTAIVGGIYLLSQFAFSSSVRKQIFKRDQGKSRWSDEPGDEAAHILHNRDNPKYNTPENGRMLTKREHYIDHINREGRNGLTIPANNAALRLIWKRLSPEERQGLPEPPEEQDW